jgi:hypothetical protein
MTIFYTSHVRLLTIMIDTIHLISDAASLRPSQKHITVVVTLLLLLVGQGIMLITILSTTSPTSPVFIYITRGY